MRPGRDPLARVFRVSREQLTFPALKRLRRKSEFDAARARGRRFGNGFFAVTVISNDKSGPRLGLAVALRVTRTAVERNRIRRIIRESFRLHQHTLPAVDVVVSARANARGASAQTLRGSLAALWRQVSERCALSPSS
ncbi:MAG: ribonuclease P protein component [Steroidobacteraceae bacterium]|jgi:ribonuclease P protein component